MLADVIVGGGDVAADDSDCGAVSTLSLYAFGRWRQQQQQKQQAKVATTRAATVTTKGAAATSLAILK